MTDAVQSAPPATPPPAARSSQATETKLRHAAEDFASVALTELLSPMFETVDTSQDAFGGGPGEKAFKPMMIAEIAKQIARSGGLGLAEPVYQQMLRLQEARR